MGDPPLDRLIATALGQLAPPGVVTGARRVGATDLADLFAVERELVRVAVARRQREFATGRALLRALMGERVPIPATPSRAPQLPAGVRASLAHDAEVAVAALSRSDAVRALGIDIEHQAAVEPDLAGDVLRGDDPAIDVTLAFCLKEAVYKAWSVPAAASGRWRVLGFADVRLDVDGDRFAGTVFDGTGVDRPTADGAAPDTVIGGRFTSACGRWVALAVAGAQG